LKAKVPGAAHIGRRCCLAQGCVGPCKAHGRNQWGSAVPAPSKHVTPPCHDHILGVFVCDPIVFAVCLRPNCV